ncbi:MAG: methylated-DNA--[protein]-cysteine S-methyltransferase [Actinomycetota bacterium]
MLHVTQFNSPFGSLKVSASLKGIRRVLLPSKEQNPIEETERLAEKHPILLQARNELTEYFNGVRQTFSVPLDIDGTQFQMDVWFSLRSIAYGETMTYGQVARSIGRPKAARAVGAANAVNPIPIILPCHRVIGANGSLIGYGGGITLLHMKQGLLTLEKTSRSDRN